MKSQTRSSNITLAVLPLQLFSDEARTAMFCQGLVMDIIADLSRFRSFQVIAYDTVHAFDPETAPDSANFKNLHLDYIVKGLARYHADSIHLTIQLIHAADGRVIWADRFAGILNDLFQIQNDIVERIVASLSHFVDHDRLSEIRRKPSTSLNAYECWLRGYQELMKGTPEADERARAFFNQALEIDPHYARAHTGMSLSYFNEWSCQLWTRWDVSKSGAFEWARKALELDEWDHISHAILGRVYLFNGEYEKAEHHFRRSLRINTNDPGTLITIALGFVYLGYLKEALELWQRARRLNPAAAFMLHACGVFVHFEQGEIDRALELAAQHELGEGWVDFPAFMAAACFLKGDMEKMQHYWQIFLDEFSRKINNGRPADTQTALQWMINVNPYRAETRLRPFWEHLSENDPEALRIDAARKERPSRNSFSRQGGIWYMNFGGKEVQLPHMKGFQDLSRLLAQPNHPLHCTDLMGARIIEKGEPVLDEKAKATYKKRILELQEEIEEAESSANSERLGALQEEYDQLIEHLTRATGKGGKARKVGSSIEKSRSAVTWRIRSAIKKIAEVHPALGKHLQVSVKTGVFCEYAPEHETDWIL